MSGQDAVCDECGHLFTAQEIAAEDEQAWGHPCHGTARKRPTVCESHRSPILVRLPRGWDRASGVQWSMPRYPSFPRSNWQARKLIADALRVYRSQLRLARAAARTIGPIIVIPKHGGDPWSNT